MNTKYSFRDFLCEPIYIDNNHSTAVKLDKVEIPIIQRDYAQGRAKADKTINETGKRFIKSIFEHLVENTDMEMDFIYGSVYSYKDKKTGDKHAFQPLDGQQRLTTLFLLYWYVGMREAGEGLEELLSILQKFTYETRTSSRRFCENLCIKEKNCYSFNESISKSIKDNAWFFKSYMKDPTISAMLTMLDTIEDQYNKNNIPNLFSRLENLKFYPFPLNEFDLTEDLYIKMNARGKQLTDFENFKADLINWMKSDKNPEKSKFNSIKEGRSLPYYLDISLKLDGDWTKLFWSISKDYDPEARDPKTKQLIYPNGKLVDPLFMRFFKRYFYLKRVFWDEKIPVEIIIEDPIVKYFYGDNNDDTVAYDSNDFEDYYVPCLSYDVVNDIETILDTFAGKYEGKSILSIVDECSNPSWGDSKDKRFYYSHLDQPGRMAFYACLEYIRSNSAFNEIRYKEWMRVVWNFIDDPMIRTIEGMVRAFRFIHNISANSKNIYEYLTSVTDENKPGQYKEQFNEEVIKANLFLDENEGEKWDEEIKKAEKMPLFKGRITSILNEELSTKIDEFISRRKAVEEIFTDNSFKTCCSDLLWIRAMLSFSEKFDFTGQISLENGQQDNWRFIISKLFIQPFRELVENARVRQEPDIKKWMAELCDSYKPKEGIEWAWPIIAWKDYEGRTLLGDYSDKCRILEENGLFYLLKTVRYSEGSIFLSNRRNELVKLLLLNESISFDWDIDSYPGIIANEYFRGTNIELSREVEWQNCKVNFKYIINRNSLSVGLQSSEEKKKLFKEYLDNKGIDTSSNQLKWIEVKSYEYPTYEDLTKLVENIENDVFSSTNPESLYSKLMQNLTLPTE